MTQAELAELNFYSLDVVHHEPAGGGPPVPLVIVVAEPGLIFRSVDGLVFEQVFDIMSLCGTTVLPSCIGGMCPSAPPLKVGFEFWDVEISRNPTSPFMLAVGGLGTGCGMVFRSTDYGLTWHSEPHECACTGLYGCFDCSGLPEYNLDPEILSDTTRWKQFTTLYSVSIFDGDNTAIASGYGGQHVRRPVTGIWQDRSQHALDIVHATTAVTTPMFGTAAGTGTSAPGQGKGLITGTGGYIRRTTDGGETWAAEVPGDPWRIKDVYFTSGDTGWVVGQYFRIAKTVSSGTFWASVFPEPVLFGDNLLAITFNAVGNRGVAVGNADNVGGPYAGRPKILYATDAFGESWTSPTMYQDQHGTVSAGRSLRDVDCSSGDVFWVAGDAGLIYVSYDGGENFRQWVPPGLTWADISDFDIQGIAFRDATTGIFVGNRATGPAAYCLNTVSGTPTWTAITPDLVSTGVVALHEVDVRGDIAYAVGDKLVDGVRQGEVFTSSWSTSVFGAFTAVPHALPFRVCQSGDNLGVVPPLAEVEIAADGRVWVAGECGRVWSYASSTWTEHKSQTDAHVQGISFPTATMGYFGCHRQGISGWSVVKYTTPQ